MAHTKKRGREGEMEMVKGESRDLPLLDYHGALKALLHNLVLVTNEDLCLLLYSLRELALLTLICPKGIKLN